MGKVVRKIGKTVRVVRKGRRKITRKFNKGQRKTTRSLKRSI